MGALSVHRPLTMLAISQRHLAKRVRLFDRQDIQGIDINVQFWPGPIPLFNCDQGVSSVAGANVYRVIR